MNILLPGASSLCGACRDVCPVRLDIPRMLLVLRDRVEREAPTSRTIGRAMKAFAWAASRPSVYRRAARLGRWSLRRLARNGWISRAPGPAP